MQVVTTLLRSVYGTEQLVFNDIFKCASEIFLSSVCALQENQREIGTRLDSFMLPDLAKQ